MPEEVDMLRQKIELIEQELGRWRTGEAVPPSEQTALGEELPLCDQVTQATEIYPNFPSMMWGLLKMPAEPRFCLPWAGCGGRGGTRWWPRTTGW